MVLLQQLKELLKEYTGDNTLLNIDESEYDLTDPDEDGLCDITIKENSKKIARSFSIKDSLDIWEKLIEVDMLDRKQISIYLFH